jgi:hypothetical protein
MTPDRRLIAALLRPLRGYAERITERITEWADTEARAAGLSVEVLPGGRRRYRDPRLDQLATHRAAGPYADVRNAVLADGEAWSIPTLTTSAGWSRRAAIRPRRRPDPDVLGAPAEPAVPATSPFDRLRRADPLQGPGRYQTRSPTSSRPAQDRFQTLRTERCAETILGSRLDPGHPAGPAPDALRAGGKNTRQPAP